jgi:hypothetical protein
MLGWSPSPRPASARILPRCVAFRDARRVARKATLGIVLGGLITAVGSTDAGAQNMSAAEVGVAHTLNADAGNGATNTVAVTLGVRTRPLLFAEDEVTRLANIASNSLPVRGPFASLPTTLPQLSSPGQASTQPVRPVSARMSKRKAALIGAAVGGGIAAVVGYGYCKSQGDCGVEGAILFAPFGAGIGAGVGLVFRLLP